MIEQLDPSMPAWKFLSIILGGLITLTVPPALVTLITLGIRQRFNREKSDKEWTSNGKDRRNGSYLEIKENLRQSDAKFKTLFGTYIPKIDRHDVELAVIEAKLKNIEDMMREVRDGLRNKG